MSWLSLGELTPLEDQGLKDLWARYYAMAPGDPARSVIKSSIDALIEKAMAPAPGEAWGTGAGARPSEYVPGGVDYGTVRQDGSFETSYTKGPGGAIYGRTDQPGPFDPRPQQRVATWVDKLAEGVRRYWKPVAVVVGVVAVGKIAYERRS